MRGQSGLPQALQNLEAGGPHRLRGRAAGQALFVKPPHPTPGRLVFHPPQAHDQRCRARRFERPPQAEHSLA